MPNLINLTEHLAQDGYEYVYGISAYDLTGNGVPDLITPDTDVGLYWLENDGRGNFTKHVIHKRTPEWLERHQVADINGDGRPELVFIDNINGCLLYFEYEGDPRLAGLLAHPLRRRRHPHRRLRRRRRRLHRQRQSRYRRFDLA